MAQERLETMQTLAETWSDTRIAEKLTDKSWGSDYSGALILSADDAEAMLQDMRDGYEAALAAYRQQAQGLPEAVRKAIDEIVDIAEEAAPYAGEYFDKKWKLSERLTAACVTLDAYLAQPTPPPLSGQGLRRVGRDAASAPLDALDGPGDYWFDGIIDYGDNDPEAIRGSVSVDNFGTELHVWTRDGGWTSAEYLHGKWTRRDKAPWDGQKGEEA